jgi:hypothetical protein
MKITISHEFAVDAETFWARCFLDESFNRALYVDSLRFPVYEVLEGREEGGLVHRKVRVAPKADAPAAVEKMLGGAFSYIEQGTLDRAANAYRFKVLPSTLADKIRAEGVFRLEKTGAKSVRRLVEMTIEVKVFGIGGLAEGFVSRAMQDTYGKAAEYTARYIAERGL